METNRPALVAPRTVTTLEAVRAVTGEGFDVDAWHCMDERDNALIADEILNGAGSSTFVYDFEVSGKRVFGISVPGAQHLANHYKGLKHRLVASAQKNGATFQFTSYPAENSPMQVSCNVVPELAQEDDFYSAIIEITDLKTGNSIQVERREPRYEHRRDGSRYERPHYSTIAQSKARRNGILALIPQDVIIRWRDEMLKLKKNETITDSVLDQKRRGVLRFAAEQGIPLERRAIERLTIDQISGLGDAARQRSAPAFVHAAESLGLGVAEAEPLPEPPSEETHQEEVPRTERRGRPRGSRNAPLRAEPPPEPSGAGVAANPTGATGPTSMPPEPPPDTPARTSGTTAPEPTPPRPAAIFEF